MALKSLTLNEMVHVTQSMLHGESPARALLGGSALLEPLLPLLEAAHARVLAVAPRPEDPRRAALAAEAVALDQVHDAVVGSLSRLLTALAELADDGPRYLHLRDRLLPQGVAGATQLTFEGEAGYAARLRARLTDATRAELAAISAGSRDLLAVVTDWLDAGDRLGELTRQQQALSLEGPAATPATVHAARLEWIRAVNALRGLAPVAGLKDEELSVLFTSLEQLEAKADARAARRRAAQVGTEAAEADDGAALADAVDVGVTPLPES